MAGRKDQPGTAPAGPRRSRRMLLAGGTGALAVLAAEALARPAPAAAANGGNVILGQDNTETTETDIINSTSGDGVLGLLASGAGGLVHRQLKRPQGCLIGRRKIVVFSSCACAVTAAWVARPPVGRRRTHIAWVFTSAR